MARDGDENLPMVIAGLVLGFVIIGLTLALTIPPLENPTGTAMIQTAGLLVGGWLILAAVRTTSKVATNIPIGISFLLIVALAAGGVYGLREMNIVMRDDVFFNAVALQRPPSLRAYLNDPRNVRHREEAQQALAKFYTDAVKKVREKGNRELTKPVTELVEALKAAPEPVVGIAVKEVWPEELKKAAGKLADDDAVKRRQAEVRNRIVDGLTLALGYDLVAFVEVPAGGPAQIEVEYTVDRQKVGWRVAVRPDPKDAGVKITAANPLAEFSPGGILGTVRTAADRTLWRMGIDPPKDGGADFK